MSRTEPTLVTPRLLRDWPLPAGGDSKYQRGRVVVLGGAGRTPGGAQLAALAALRVGAGHLTMAVAEPVAAALAVATPEAAVYGLSCDRSGSVLPDDVGELAGRLESADAVIIGPGLDAPELTRGVVAAALPLLGPDTALVLDAFALGVLPELPPLDDELARRTVLTPNEKEAERLLGRPLGDDFEAGLAEIVERYGALVACADLIVSRSGDRWRNSAGTHGLATSGSGDVLAGALGGLLARGAGPAQAACWAKYLHAGAAERLAVRIGRLGFLAREVLDELPAGLTQLS